MCSDVVHGIVLHCLLGLLMCWQAGGDEIGGTRKHIGPETPPNIKGMCRADDSQKSIRTRPWSMLQFQPLVKEATDKRAFSLDADALRDIKGMSCVKFSFCQVTDPVPASCCRYRRL